MRRVATGLFLFLFTILPSSFAQIPAFPGAEGFGSATPGGRGGRVIYVTTLNPSGPGSISEAVGSSGPRIVVFKVGGTIEFNPPATLTISNPFITIAGQTAPGGGITLKSCNLVLGTHDIILRGIRSRLGDAPGGILGGRRDPIRVGSESDGEVYNVIIDHCSMSWSVDEGTEVIGGSTHHVTVQYCYVGESLDCSIHVKGCHSKGLSAHNTGGGNVSFHHNIIAHSRDRNPQMLASSNIECVNNVVYNYEFGGRYGNGAQVNFVGNRYIPGPDTPPNRYGLVHLIDDATSTTRVYVRGNIGNGRPTNTGNEWLIARDAATFRSMAPLFTENVSAEDVDEMWPSILDRAGCMPHDPVDERIKSDILNGTGGWIDSQNELGGWPALDPGPAPLDSDNDGMPNSWETAAGLNPSDPSDGSGDLDGNGYTNVEDYINGIIMQGGGGTTTGGSPGTIPQQTGLWQNFPNPFNPTTTIGYTLEEGGHVNLTVYNLLGQPVVELVDAMQNAGYREVVWAGRNGKDEPVTSSVYFYRIEFTGESGSVYVNQKRMILVK